MWRFHAPRADIGTMAKTARNASTRSGASEDATDSPTPAASHDLARKRILWVLAASLYALLVVSLASFRSSDWPTHVVATPTDPPLNLCGKFGAALAYELYFTLGFGVWIPVVYLGVLLAYAALGRTIAHPFVRFVGCLIAMSAFGGLHAEWFPTVGPLTGVDAGLVPMWFAEELHARFGPFGASLAFLATFVVGAIVTADALVFMIPGAVGRALSFLAPVWETDWKGHFGALRERFSAMFPQPAPAGGRARRSAARPTVPVAKSSTAVVESDEDEDADDDVDGDDASEDGDEGDLEDGLDDGGEECGEVDTDGDRSAAGVAIATTAPVAAVDATQAGRAAANSSAKRWMSAAGMPDFCSAHCGV